MFSKQTFYGSDTPNRITVVCMNIIYAVFVFIFYGAWVDFIPSENWQEICATVAATLSAVLAIYILYVAFIQRSLVIPEQGLLKVSIGLLLIPFITFLFLWVALSQGVPALFTRIAGTDHTESVVLIYEHSSSRHGCFDRLRGPSLDRAFTNYLCAPPSMRVSQPQRIILSGKSSFMGFYVIALRSDR